MPVGRFQVIKVYINFIESALQSVHARLKLAVVYCVMQSDGNSLWRCRLGQLLHGIQGLRQYFTKSMNSKQLGIFIKKILNSKRQCIVREIQDNKELIRFGFSAENILCSHRNLYTLYCYCCVSMHCRIILYTLS